MCSWWLRISVINSLLYLELRTVLFDFLVLFFISVCWQFTMTRDTKNRFRLWKGFCPLTSQQGWIYEDMSPRASRSFAGAFRGRNDRFITNMQCRWFQNHLSRGTIGILSWLPAPVQYNYSLPISRFIMFWSAFSYLCTAYLKQFLTQKFLGPQTRG